MCRPARRAGSAPLREVEDFPVRVPEGRPRQGLPVQQAVLAVRRRQWRPDRRRCLSTSTCVSLILPLSIREMRLASAPSFSPSLCWLMPARSRILARSVPSSSADAVVSITAFLPGSGEAGQHRCDHCIACLFRVNSKLAKQTSQYCWPGVRRPEDTRPLKDAARSLRSSISGRCAAGCDTNPSKGLISTDFDKAETEKAAARMRPGSGCARCGRSFHRRASRNSGWIIRAGQSEAVMSQKRHSAALGVLNGGSTLATNSMK